MASQEKECEVAMIAITGVLNFMGGTQGGGGFRLMVEDGEGAGGAEEQAGACLAHLQRLTP